MVEGLYGFPVGLDSVLAVLAGEKFFSRRLSSDWGQDYAPGTSDPFEVTIPQRYAHLLCFFTFQFAGGGGVDGIKVRINNEPSSSTNYDQQQLSGVQSTAAAGASQAANPFWTFTGIGDGGFGYPTTLLGWIPHYREQFFLKQSLWFGGYLSNDGNTKVYIYSAGWRKKDPITMLSFGYGSGFKAGSHLEFYGLY